MQMKGNDATNAVLSAPSDTHPAQELAAQYSFVPGAQYPPSLAGADTLDVRGILNVLWQRKFQVILIASVLTAMSAYLIFHLAPRYGAEAIILTGERPANLLRPNDRVSSLIPDEEAVQSEVQILSSGNLARQVIAKLNLTAYPEFNPSLRPKDTSILNIVSNHVKRLLQQLGLARPSARQQHLDPETAALNQYFKALGVSPIGRSRAVRVDFASQSPIIAAAVPNMLVELYQQRQMKLKQTAAEEASDWLGEHLAVLRERAQQADAAVDVYRSSQGMIRGKDAILTAEETSSVLLQLEQAQARLAQATTRLNAARSLPSKNYDEAVLEVVQSPLIVDLKQQQATLTARIAKLGETYGPRHPLALAAEAERDSLNKTIARETAKIVAQLSSDVREDAATVAVMKARFDQLKQQALQQEVAKAKLATLEREAAADDSIYRNVLERSKEMETQNGQYSAESDILSRAVIPDQPLFPNKKMLLLLSLIVSSACAVGGVMMLEKRNQGIVSTEQVEKWLGANAIGLVPAVKGLRSVADAPKLCSPEPLQAPFVESIRDLHAKLSLRRAGSPKTIMLASALPGEGKSAVSVALALLIARTGRRTVLIDGDLRKPRLHLAFGLEPTPGLVDYLAGSVTLEDISRGPEAGPLHVIPSGGSASHPADLLGSMRMKTLIAALSQYFDTIVIDTPPVLAAADALVLAPEVDATIFLVKWGKTPQQAAGRALRLLLAAGANVNGVALSMVNVNRMLRYKLDSYYPRGAFRYLQT
jgi:polysaccharide biosynthesis transport protein